MREKQEADFSYQGSTDIWVADFGTDGIAEDIDREVNKMKIKKPKKVSWVFLSILVFIIIVTLEYFLNKFVSDLKWSSIAIMWATWIWRFLLLMFWFFIARVKYLLDYTKIAVVSFMSFVALAVFSALHKIIFVGTLWTWLNFIVEPLWMIILIIVSFALFLKIKK